MPTNEPLRTYSTRWLKKRSAAQLKRLLNSLAPGSPERDLIARALAERRREDLRKSLMGWGKLALALVLACIAVALWKYRYLFVPG